jgi:hypothetical protein
MKSGTCLLQKHMCTDVSMRNVESPNDILGLPDEICHKILKVTVADGTNLVKNRMALVVRLWHNAITGKTGVCMEELTRVVKLSDAAMREAGMEMGQWSCCVHVHGWGNIRDAALKGLANACVHLTRLTIWDCDITDAGLASLAAGCPSIATLRLNGYIQITDAGLASLAAGCNRITTLRLSGCPQITDAGLASLAARCKCITTLRLSDCPQITDKGLASLAARCKRITTLYLDGCTQITDKGLASLAAGCKCITTLYLKCCNQITDKGLESLVAGCIAITTLYFRCCNQILLI